MRNSAGHEVLTISRTPLAVTENGTEEGLPTPLAVTENGTEEGLPQEGLLDPAAAET